MGQQGLVYCGQCSGVTVKSCRRPKKLSLLRPVRKSIYKHQTLILVGVLPPRHSITRGSVSNAK